MFIFAISKSKSLFTRVAEVDSNFNDFSSNNLDIMITNEIAIAFKRLGTRLLQSTYKTITTALYWPFFYIEIISLRESLDISHYVGSTALTAAFVVHFILSFWFFYYLFAIKVLANDKEQTKEKVLGTLSRESPSNTGIKTDWTHVNIIVGFRVDISNGIDWSLLWRYLDYMTRYVIR